MTDKPAPAEITAQLETVFAAASPVRKKRPVRPKLPVPSGIDLVGMTNAELEAGGLAYLEQRNLKASALCLRELQRRRGPFGLNPLGKADTVR